MSKTVWKQTEATVFTCGWQSKYSPHGTDIGQNLITFSYEIDGNWYSGEFHSLTTRDEGSKFTLRYDANNPEHTEYSLDKALNSSLATIIGWVAAIAAVALYVWFRDFRHH